MRNGAHKRQVAGRRRTSFLSVAIELLGSHDADGCQGGQAPSMSSLKKVQHILDRTPGVATNCWPPGGVLRSHSSL